MLDICLEQLPRHKRLPLILEKQEKIYYSILP